MDKSIAKQLESCKSFSAIFRLVKRCVREVLGQERAGLSLGLSMLPPDVGATYSVTSNFIILNKLFLLLLRELIPDRKIINSYIFYVLLREYLHSLGITSEKAVKKLAVKVCTKKLGRDHPATQMARKGIQAIIPDLPKLRRYKGEINPLEIEIIEDFDKDTVDYIM